MADNGKWQLAFWIVTGLFVAMALGLGNSVSANEKASRDRDEFIKDCFYKQNQEVIQRLSRIETKIEGKVIYDNRNP